MAKICLLETPVQSEEHFRKVQLGAKQRAHLKNHTKKTNGERRGRIATLKHFKTLFCEFPVGTCNQCSPPSPPPKKKRKGEREGPFSPSPPLSSDPPNKNKNGGVPRTNRRLSLGSRSRRPDTKLRKLLLLCSLGCARTATLAEPNPRTAGKRGTNFGVPKVGNKPDGHES